MKTFIYDTETFKYDWLFIAKELGSEKYEVIYNDNDELIEFLKEHEEDIFIGFNSKRYDKYIVKGIYNHLDNIEMKQLNDYLISGGNGWEHPDLKYMYNPVFNNVDIMDDMQMGLSLKSIEGHLGMNIQESEIDFDIDRPLTKDELDSTIYYCKHDVDATEKIVELRKDYLKNKMTIGELAGIEVTKALSYTNAKLTSVLLKAVKKEHDDERKYVIPHNLLKEYIPDDVLAFYNRIKDESISDEELFSSKLDFKIDDTEVTMSFGGIHGDIKFYRKKATEDRVIINADVSSYYPHLAIIYHYTSRNIPDPDIYKKVVEDRMKAKASGDKATANALKLIVNTSYGATLNSTNDLYDPLMARSTCISGQLFLLELAMHLVKSCKEVKVIQLNTDGIMISLPKAELDKAQEIMNEWQERTGFTLETDHIQEIIQSNVNNYIEVQTDGSVKKKGLYLVRGISKAGAFNINNNAIIVAKAIEDYLVKNIPIETTIGECDDLSQYQFIAKASSKYSRAYQIIGDKEVPTQKVNRVYAAKNKEYGRLYKVKKENGQIAKIENLPEHCIIDNDNHLTIADIDKDWYIEYAHKKLNDFLGIDNKGGKMAEGTATKTTTKKAEPKLTVWQKLTKARRMFLEENIQKSGFNQSGNGFFYFELSDIVPPATKIFDEVGLTQTMHFTEKDAYAHVYNAENPEETPAFFSIPFDKQDPIISREGKVVTPKIQCMGASVTYYRRYLWQLILDIVEQDEVDSTDTSVKLEKAQEPSKNNKPATVEERAEITQELANPEDNADELMLEGLKNLCKKLIEKDPSKQHIVDGLGVKTHGWTVITKTDCEKVMANIKAMLGE